MQHTLGALRSQWFFPESKRPPGPTEFKLVNRYAGFQVVTRTNYEELRGECPGVRYLTNCVDPARFPHPPDYGRLVASWNGNSAHSNATKEDVKGFHTVIVPACNRARVRLEYADRAMGTQLPRERMPEFYRQGTVALSASGYEGASSSVMESMAAGLALITTDVGNAREMHESMLARRGESGIMLVDRSVEAFVDALNWLKLHRAAVEKMGLLNREEIALNWSWDAWKDRFADFLMLPVS